MKLRNYKDAEITNKVVFIRLDLNVPIIDRDVANDFKIVKSIPCINECFSKNPRTIIIGSHLGRPKKAYDPFFSLKKVYEKTIKYLDESTSKMFIKIEDLLIDPKLYFDKYKFIFLENLRFYPEEKNENSEYSLFTELFKKYVDTVIIDSFGVLHRYCGSISGIARYKKLYAGPLIQKEMEVYSEMKKRGVNLLILGGSKIPDKIKLTELLIDRCRAVFVAGGMAYTFLKHRYDKEIGKSICDSSSYKIVDHIYALAKKNNTEIYLPVDFTVLENDSIYTTKEIPVEAEAMDIGPESIKALENLVFKFDNVFWNGPVGVFEVESFSNGTRAVVDMLEKKKGMVIVGGGETASAVSLYGDGSSFYHVSTGGGAFIKLLSGGKIPGLDGLFDDNENSTNL